MLAAAKRAGIEPIVATEVTIGHGLDGGKQLGLVGGLLGKQGYYE